MKQSRDRLKRIVDCKSGIRGWNRIAIKCKGRAKKWQYMLIWGARMARKLEYNKEAVAKLPFSTANIPGKCFGSL
jgi:hypothetical protein